MGAWPGRLNWLIRQRTESPIDTLVKVLTSKLATSIFTLYLDGEWFASGWADYLSLAAA